MTENLTYTHTEDGEVHPGEVVEEKISLSERFGLWVSLHRSAKTVPDDHGAMASFGVTAEAIANASSGWCGPSTQLAQWPRGLVARDYAGRADALVAC
jgi:hypothetical protein